MFMSLAHLLLLPLPLLASYSGNGNPRYVSTSVRLLFAKFKLLSGRSWELPWDYFPNCRMTSKLVALLLSIRDPPQPLRIASATVIFSVIQYSWLESGGYFTLSLFLSLHRPIYLSIHLPRIRYSYSGAPVLPFWVLCSTSPAALPSSSSSWSSSLYSHPRLLTRDLFAW